MDFINEQNRARAKLLFTTGIGDGRAQVFNT
jgi:hypothetical protein